MRTFEVGKRYGEHAVVFEIVKRTAKTITYAAIHHSGRYNESRREEKKVKIQNWDGREVFFAGMETSPLLSFTLHSCQRGSYFF